MKKSFPVILFLLPVIVHAQVIFVNEIKGTVYDSVTNTPLAGALVYIKGTTRHTFTNAEGNYNIMAEKGDTLEFSLQRYTSGSAIVKKKTVINAFLLTETAQPPNIIFILADDLGWVQTSPYGNKYYSTPNIDRLAREGMRFTDAYAAAPVCSPSRASIMTGKYPARLHLTDYIHGGTPRGDPLTTPEWQRFLPLEEYTIGELFRDNGYQTALFGKWHLSQDKRPPKSLPYNPDKQGFEQIMITYKPNESPAGPSDPEHDPHMSDSIGNRSLQFLKARSGKPFFLFMSFDAIHDPDMESADSIARRMRENGSRRPENNPVIAAIMKRMDDNIGKVLDEVDKEGIKSNTIIIFFSDNGGLVADASQSPLRAGKGWLYEGGIREPLIVRWPGKIIPGSESHERISSIDFMPTFCDLLDAKVPKNVDGISLLTHLQTGAALPARNLYWHYPHYMRALDAFPCGAVVSGKWKLIEWYEKSLLGNKAAAYELYDLERDKSETVNLAGSNSSTVMQLAADLDNWRKKVNAQMPQPNKDVAAKPTYIKFDDTRKLPFGEGFELVQIKSAADGALQHAYYYRSTSKKPAPLVVSLHTWSGGYTQKDTLSILCKEKNVNYIHPDFRGPNKTVQACCSDLALADMDDAIAFAIQQGNVDTSRIYVIGVSGGGYATLAMFMRSRYRIRKFSAWASISDLAAWYADSRERKNEYADMILACTGSPERFDAAKAKNRSPLYWNMPSGRSTATLDIYEGINDGITGSVPITHSINFYNKLLADLHVKDSSRYVSAAETKRMLDTRKPLGQLGKIGDRDICLQKRYKNIQLVIFTGGHEMLPVYAFDELLKK